MVQELIRYLRVQETKCKEETMVGAQCKEQWYVPSVKNNGRYPV